LRQAFAGGHALPPGLDYAAHLCVLRSRFRPALIAHLAHDAIGSDIHYPISDHHQPALSGAFVSDLSLPQAEAAAAEVLSVPCFPELSAEEIDRICGSLARFAVWASRQ
jgi:aminotransferase EvaB